MKRVMTAALLLVAIALSGCDGNPGTAPGEGGPVPVQQKLYPVWKLTPQGKLWGYMDETGKVVVSPQYESADFFTAEGTAVVGQEGKKGLISAKGQLLKPVYDSLTPFGGGRLVGVRDGSWTELVNAAGKAVYETGLSIRPMPEGGAHIQEYVGDQTLEGYIDDAGTVTLEPQYLQASDFVGGRAVVKRGGNAYAIIDTEGKPLAEFEAASVQAPSEGLFPYQKAGKQPGLWGYRDMTGQVTVAAAYSEAMPFVGGQAVVGQKQQGTVRYGIIDARGKFVLRPKYGRIEALGNGFYAISRQLGEAVPEANRLYAVFNSAGKRLTDYLYYEVAACTSDTVSVSDGTETWVVDSAGEPMSTMPRLAGQGAVRREGELLVSQVEDERAYFTLQGALVWQSPFEAVLKDSLKVKRLKYRPDRGTVIYYPVLEGFSDPAVQQTINSVLQQAFLDGAGGNLPVEGVLQETLWGDYTLQVNKDLLIVDRQEQRTAVADGSRREIRQRLHIDLRSGNPFGLQDLFRPDSGWGDLLAEQVRLQIGLMAADPAPLLAERVTSVTADRAFLAGRYGLQLTYDRGELGGTAGEPVTFEIPYAALLKAISTEGPFWNAFLKQDM